MKAYGMYVLISPEKTDSKTKKGVILDNKVIRFRKAVVESSPVKEIKNGAMIIYDSSNAHETMIDNVKYLITRLADIAIII